MQEFTQDFDPSLDLDNVREEGRKLKNLPSGWTFETQVLTRNLSSRGKSGFRCRYKENEHEKTGLFDAVLRRRDPPGGVAR
jgi:hypothetical protein